MKTINIGGEDRPILFDINALSEFNESTGTSLGWIFQIAENPGLMNFNQIRNLIYWGLRTGAEEKGIDVDFTLKDVGRWLSKDFSTFPKAMNFLNEDMPMMEDDEKNLKGSENPGQ